MIVCLRCGHETSDPYDAWRHTEFDCPHAAENPMTRLQSLQAQKLHLLDNLDTVNRELAATVTAAVEAGFALSDICTVLGIGPDDDA